MIYLSHSNDPFSNLALEHHLFQTTHFPALFLYQNSPSVIIGRAQNPWVECDMRFLQEQNIPLLRRQSGGGTVFHDLGNLNFTFFVDKNNYDKSKNLALIIKALAKLQAPVMMNERHDLILQDKKISGSAFRETRTHAFHHATLLIASDLNLLRRSLKAPALNIKSKGVPSVKSSVINLQDVYPHLTLPAIIQSIIEVFKTHYHMTADVTMVNSAPAELIQKYHTDAWRFGKTLPFTHTLNDGSVIEVESGVIMHIETNNPDLKKWQHQPYALFFAESTID
jgi:lipoate---protein ligase